MDDKLEEKLITIECIAAICAGVLVVLAFLSYFEIFVTFRAIRLCGFSVLCAGIAIGIGKITNDGNAYESRNNLRDNSY